MPRQQLSFLDSTNIIIGIVIGVGIYETSPLVAQSVTTPLWLIALWLLGGVLSLVGALCYAELATSFPEEGGDYIYLSRAWGSRMGFLFAWAGFWLVRPANIGAIAFIFAHYARQISPADLDATILALAAVIVLTVINVVGVKSGKWIQNILTAAKVLGLLLIIAIGLLAYSPEMQPAAGDNLQTGSNFYLAMILVLFTYGGWSNISYVAAEVVHPQRNILRSLLAGTLVITAIYIVVNLAFLRMLGLEGMSASRAIASDMLQLALGDAGAVFISVLICITCLSALNGMILTEARIYYALGREHHLYRVLGKWNKKLDAPVWSLTLQAAITLILILIFGSNEDAFERLVIFSAPLHWFFFLLTGLALFRFRARNWNTGSFSVPLYPWLPALFCLSTLFMLYASIAYAIDQRHPEVYGIIIITILGIIASLYNPPPAGRNSNRKNQSLRD
ncbi:MAG TPA: amino acid permease [Gammaproteobacteria bacterium]|nr:amino acid permease [Gammaproteobacteria bacterium]